MENETLCLLLNKLESLERDIRELREGITKLYFKIAVVATVSGIAGGKAVSFAEGLANSIREAIKVVVG